MRKLEIPKMMSANPDPTATIPRTGSWPGNRKGFTQLVLVRVTDVHIQISKKIKPAKWPNKMWLCPPWRQTSANLELRQPETHLTSSTHKYTGYHTNTFLGLLKKPLWKSPLYSVCFRSSADVRRLTVFGQLDSRQVKPNLTRKHCL